MTIFDNWCVTHGNYPCVCKDQYREEINPHVAAANAPPPVPACKACACDNICPDHPTATTSAMERRHAAMEAYADLGMTGVDRAVHNSPPPLDDVGEDVSHMLDEKDPAFDTDNPGVADIFQFDPTDALLADRAKTHGSFAQNAAAGQTLRTFFRASKGWASATDRQREALDYIAGKLSRILSGQPGHADHWDDIAGYAKLACNPDLQR